MRLAARQVGDQLQVRSRDEVGVGKAGGGGRGRLDVLHRGQLGGHQVEGALVNLIDGEDKKAPFTNDVHKIVRILDPRPRPYLKNRATSPLPT